MAEFVYFRYVLAGIAFYCVLVVHLTGSSFNVTILKMINNNKNCTDDNKTDTDTFCWSKGTVQSRVLLNNEYIRF